MSDRIDCPDLCKDCPAQMLGQEYVDDCFSSQRYFGEIFCIGKYYHSKALFYALSDVTSRICFGAIKKYHQEKWDEINEK